MEWWSSFSHKVEQLVYCRLRVFCGEINHQQRLLPLLGGKIQNLLTGRRKVAFLILKTFYLFDASLRIRSTFSKTDRINQRNRPDRLIMTPSSIMETLALFLHCYNYLCMGWSVTTFSPDLVPKDFHLFPSMKGSHSERLKKIRVKKFSPTDLCWVR